VKRSGQGGRLQKRLEIREGEDDRRTSDVVLEIRGLSDAGDFEGYGSVFNVEDSYGDVVAPGAFARTISEHKTAGTMPAMLWQHNSREPVGVWQEMSEDANGLKLKGRLLLETQLGRETHAILKAGAIRGLSIGFMTRAFEWNEESQIRTVTDADLWEISLVTFAANKRATVLGVKGTEISTERDLEKALRDAGMSKTDAKAAVARVRSSILDRRDALDGIDSALSSARRLLQTLNS
jgi:HK97 family phage prohead protease